MPRVKVQAKKSGKSKKGKKRELGKLERFQLLANSVNAQLAKEDSDGEVYLASRHPPLERVRTGILALDYVSGGGIPKARVTQFTGEESSAKTLSALHVTSAFQKADDEAIVLWIAREDFDVTWASRFVDTDRLVLARARAGDTSLETGMTLLESGDVDLMVLDAIQTFGTSRELGDGVDSESYAGAGAPQLWGRVFRRWTAAVNSWKSKAALLGISQVRATIGGGGKPGGPPPDPKGTQIMAWRHWKALDVYFKKGGYEVEGTTERRRLVHQEFRVRGLKNKTSLPELQSAFTFHFRDHDEIPFGIDNATTAVRLGVAYELIELAGSHYKGYGIKTQGEDNFVAKLRKQPSIITEIGTDILNEVTR